MRISPITKARSDSRKNVKFESYNPVVARKLEKDFANSGIKCNLGGNDFVGECYRKIVIIFQKLFDKSHLPSKLSYNSLGQGCFGIYDCREDEVTVNKDYGNDCYYDMEHLKSQAKKLYRKILPGWNSTGHPAHVFAHEFGHCTHWHHLVQRNGEENAMKVWLGLVGTTVPTAIGRLITKFNLSKYAVESKDMCEFMAERIAKDVCADMEEDSWTIFNHVDVKYSDIFSRKWDYRYSSPQSYIDYFVQQVWNGDIEEAKRAGQLAEEYLKEIEAVKVAPVVQKVATTLDPTPIAPITIQRTILSANIEKKEPQKSKSFFRKIGSYIAKQLVELNEKITESLDERNKLKLNNRIKLR